MRSTPATATPSARTCASSVGDSQDALALRTGIARSYMGGIERGEKNHALNHIVRLAAGLDVAPAGLMPPPP